MAPQTFSLPQGKAVAPKSFGFASDRDKQFVVLRQVGGALTDETPNFAFACEVITDNVANWVALDLFDDGDQLYRVGEAGRKFTDTCPPFDEHYFPATLLPLETPRIISPAPKGKAWILRPDKKVLYPAGEQTIVISPLLFAGRCLGLLSLGWRVKAPLESIDLDFITEVTRLFAFAAETQRLQREANRIRSMRDEMLSVVSHDLKNPLTAMLVSASLLEERAGRMSDDQGNRFKKLSTSIRRSAERMNGLLSDLLDIVRIEAGRLKFEAKPANFAALVDDALKAVGPLCEQRNVGVGITSKPAGEAWVEGDRDRLQRVAANLITCAVQATPAGGKVSVDLALDTTAGTLVFEVTDSGSLLDDSQRSSLFNALWRASEQAKGPAGLSLTASKGIIEQHGGRLELVPSASGNCLRCMLPLNSTPLPA